VKPKQIGTKKVTIEGKEYTVKVYAPGESHNNPMGSRPFGWKIKAHEDEREVARRMERQ
jgi:hypothetical protein